MKYFDCENELQFLHEAATYCSGKSFGRDAVWQVAPVMTSIPYTEGCIENLESFEELIESQLPLLSTHGKNRAYKAFINRKDTITKPSYINRIDGSYVDGEINQFGNLVDSFLKEPTSGGLAFNVFHPKDLIDKYRPGYVPCLVSGTFLLHDNELHLNIFFRGQSILEFGLHDLKFLRNFQLRFIDEVSAFPKSIFPKRSCPANIAAGPLNIHFSRVTIPSRLARSKNEYIRRSECFDVWVESLVQTIDDSEAMRNRENSSNNLTLGKNYERFFL